MREGGPVTVVRPRARLWFALGALLAWLVIQNGVLLLIWSWPVWPAAWAVARALLRLGAPLAAPLAAAALVAGGAGSLWVDSRRSTSPPGRRIEEARHG